MSKKKFDSAQASKEAADSVSLTDSVEKMWQNLKYLGYHVGNGAERIDIERNTAGFSLPDGNIRLVAGTNSWRLDKIVSGADTWTWNFDLNLWENFLHFDSFPVGRVQDCVFKYDGGEAPVKILRTPSELKERAAYVLDGFDQGKEDLLLNYNKFHSLKISYTGGVEEWKEVVDLTKIAGISYPADAKYNIDFMVGGALVENRSGQSSAEGLPLGEMDPESNYVRMRYKDSENLYYGKVSLVLHFVNSTVLKLSLPVEVIKPEAK